MNPVYVNLPKLMYPLTQIDLRGGWLFIIRDIPIEEKYKGIIRPLNIVWAHNVLIPKSIADKISMAISKPKSLPLAQNITEYALENKYDSETLLSRLEYMCDDYESFTLLSKIEGNPFVYEISNPYSVTIRLKEHEVNKVTDDRLDIYLREDIFIPHSFSSTDNNGKSSLFQDNEYIRDIFGALMLDGLTESEALTHMLEIDEDIDFESIQSVHKDYYYKPDDMYANTLRKLIV